MGTPTNSPIPRVVTTPVSRVPLAFPVISRIKSSNSPVTSKIANRLNRLKTVMSTIPKETEEPPGANISSKVTVEHAATITNKANNGINRKRLVMGEDPFCFQRHTSRRQTLCTIVKSVRFQQRLFQQINHVQCSRPLAQVSKVQTLALRLDDTQDVAPLSI
jgi:hypothetical protein